MVLNYYSKQVLAILLLMILSGAGRTIGIKLFFQLGFDDPFLTAYLMLFAHSLAIPLYYCLSYFDGSDDKESNAPTEDEESQQEGEPGKDLGDKEVSEAPTSKSRSFYHSFAVPLYNEIFYPEGPPKEVLERQKRAREASSAFSFWPHHLGTIDENSQWNDQASKDYQGPAVGAFTLLRTATFQSSLHGDERRTAPPDTSTSRHSIKGTLEGTKWEETSCYNEKDDITAASTEEKDQGVLPQKGSVAGLSDESREAIQWIHKIPNSAKPVVSSVFNMLDVTFRMLAVLNLPASIMEMTTGGLELVFSILAARWIRKREIYMARWMGAGIVVTGLVLVASSDLTNDKGEKSPSSSLGLGLLFVVLKTFSSCLKDMSQELFMQESNYPATLLLGFEGLYGLILAVVLSYAFGPAFGYKPDFTFLFESLQRAAATLGLVVVLFLGGIYSILGTALTSSMTCNMWKNFRGLLVWTIGLVIYYSSSNENLGEPFVVPGSFLLLIGFAIMLFGLHVYYKR